MPEITSEKREDINRRLARRREIEDLFTESSWESQHCCFCNWASNGRSVDLRSFGELPVAAEWGYSRLGCYVG